ncbi:MAG TPA: glycolate oxidase subunit GlcE [Methylibium sp.]|uniref:glycolate oxidase subunit GlcE n=1 Tax=Methylibium sp. TaxID=2067992 RepID=UPI002DB8291B|nr:glycolate oxidase subunit GlcE [Methylibium sp.]HEU4460352.1 glycolate oxidase subunit GlcE [Methylibium sp.]
MASPQHPALAALIDRVRTAQERATPLAVAGHGSKCFYGGPVVGEPLDTTALAGISSYEPTELVVTARAGTPIVELEAALAERGQHLPFEPPRFAGGPGGRGTVGGMVATGLSGPARASAGAVRDHVLGATLLNGRGQVLSFGGQVIKNVAGYDVSRLLCGSMGVLGVILEVSLKVLPVAPATATLRFEIDEAAALERINRWGGQPLPIGASAWWAGMLVVRLRGARAAVEAAAVSLSARFGGERIDDALAEGFWRGLRDHDDEFFVKARAAVASNSGAALWRLSLPATAAPLALHGEQMIEWGGAQRWWCTAQSAASVREAAQQLGGHATLFHGADKSQGVFTPLAAPLDRIHRELKREFDPAGIFNRGRLYPDL